MSRHGYPAGSGSAADFAAPTHLPPGSRPSPINEAGITATFAAIFARLDAHNEDADLLHGRIAALETDVERLQSARISPQEAPESVARVSEVSQEPGNASERIPSLWRTLSDPTCPSPICAGRPDRCGRFSFPQRCDDLCSMADGKVKQTAEIRAALRMYRKVQALEANGFAVRSIHGAHVASNTAASLLAYLKESQA